jgi:hypothetical protein
MRPELLMIMEQPEPTRLAIATTEEPADPGLREAVGLQAGPWAS